MIPWTLIALTSGAFAVAFISHLASLFGIDTSQRPRL
jgi:hypothetical protein